MSTSMGFLPGYQAQPCDNGVDHSEQKLRDAANDLAPWVDPCLMHSMACRSEEETWAYRCVCTFQLLYVDGRFQYAMRHQQRPYALESDVFPIATNRIQRAMKQLVGYLIEGDPLSIHLTSVSFASSWSDHPTCDCFVTLHYCDPIDEDLWKPTAQSVCDTLRLTKLIGRSKGRVFFVTGNGPSRNFLKDCIYVILKPDQALMRATLSKDAVKDDDYIEVHYQKPESAFFHPNSHAMLQALEWMMSRLALITNLQGEASSMLEMYCGCGAHTVALAKSGFIKQIVAVELDNRLVDACITNCKINRCHGNDSIPGVSPVFVFQGDASDWAQKSIKKKSGWYDSDYSILLVDPPRMGLDDIVCRMAMEGTFHDLLYVSCGRHALKRDLDTLKHAFEVVDCRLLDLFPRTDSVESLVHLSRRRSIQIANALL